MPDPIKGNPNPGGAPVKAQDPANPGKTGEQNTKTVPLEALHEARDQNRQIREELETLKTVVTNLGNNATPKATPGYTPPPVHNETFIENKRALDELWDTDPRRAMQTELSMALNYYDETQALLDQQEEEAAKKYPDYDKYRQKIKGYVRMVKPEDRRRPGTIDTAYYLAKGQDTDSVKQQAIDELLAKIKAGEAVQGLEGASGTMHTEPSTLKPTAEQMRAADAMGMPIEDYLKFVKQ